MQYSLPLIALVFFVGCADKDSPVHDETPAVATESPNPHADSGDLTGTWKLAEQKGYGPDHPGDVEQTLIFEDNGRLTNTQSAGGQTSEMVLTYRIEGDETKASVESVKMGGKPLDVAEEMPKQTFRWRIEDGRLLLDGTQPGTQDVYIRVD